MPLKSGSKTADEFQIWVDFPTGNLQALVAKYEVADLPTHGQAKKGTGTFTVDDKGGTASMTFKGTTPDNVTIDAAIECKQVSK